MKRPSFFPVLHYSGLRPNLLDYGIEIPLSADRTKDTLAELEKESELWSQRQHWLDIISPPVMTWEDIERVHNQAYVQQLKKDPEAALLTTYELIGIDGLPHRYNPANAKKSLVELRDIQFKHVGALEMAAEKALKVGGAYLLGGGLHHAMSFGGRGFCLVNDGVIVLSKLLFERKIKRAWVIDVDAHKGDGTAELTQHISEIQTLSIHMARGWPLEDTSTDEMGNLRPWHIPSTLDIPLESGEEGVYLQRLQQGLEKLESQFPLPDLALIVQGSDPYELDSLPSTALMKLSLKQLEERDRLVFDFFYQRGIAQVYVMAGGYGPHAYQVYAQFLKYFITHGQKR